MPREPPDASDWAPTSIPELYKFESHLQCPMCRELMSRAPTITECGHTFCNECISRHIRLENKCPLCRHEIQQGKLRLNKIVDDLLETWINTDLREKLLETVKPNNIPPVVYNPLESEDLTSELSSELPTSEPSSTAEIPEGYSSCPICHEVLQIDVIQGAHITNCLSQNPPGTQTKRQSVLSVNIKASPRKKRAVFAAPAEDVPKSKIPVPSLYTMSETKIKAKLREAGLSLKGSKAQLINRYVEWVTIWNASVNEKHPRSIKELQKQMQMWDKQQNQGTSTSLKELDGEKWSKNNKDNFEELISQARASLNKKDV